jgi:hypothetical protein
MKFHLQADKSLFQFHIYLGMTAPARRLDAHEGRYLIDPPCLSRPGSGKTGSSRICREL